MASPPRTKGRVLYKTGQSQKGHSPKRTEPGGSRNAGVWARDWLRHLLSPTRRRYASSPSSYHLLRLGGAGQLVELLLVLRPEVGPEVRVALPYAGGVTVADALEELRHPVHPTLVGDGRVDDLGERPRAGRTHERAGRDEVGEVERRDTELLALLDDRRRADGEVGLHRFHRGAIVFEGGAELDLHALRLEPVTIGLGLWGLRAGRADIGHVGPALDEKPGDEKLRALVARKRDRALDGGGGERVPDRGEERILGGCHLFGGQPEGVADILQPFGGAVVAHGGRTDDGPAGGGEFAHRRGVERMDCRDRAAVEGRVEFTPFTAGDDRAHGETEGIEHAPDHHRVGGEHLAQKRDGGPV